MKSLRNTNEKSQRTKLLKIFKVFTFKKTFQKKTSSSEINTIVGVQYRQRKVWSFSDIFTLKQRRKEEEEKTNDKDDSYVGPEDIFPYNCLELEYNMNLKEIKRNPVIGREAMITEIPQKSLHEVIVEAKMELKKKKQVKTLIMDCNYVPIEILDADIDIKKRRKCQIRGRKKSEDSEFSPMNSDYVDMTGSG